MLDTVYQNEISHNVSMAFEKVKEVANSFYNPSVQYRPRIYIDGNKWCALYGDNLQDGVCGFGDSPAEAMQDFDKEWFAKLNK